MSGELFTINALCPYCGNRTEEQTHDRAKLAADDDVHVCVLCRRITIAKWVGSTLTLREPTYDELTLAERMPDVAALRELLDESQQG